MPVTASKFRSDMFHLLSEVLETGKPLEVELKGRKLLIVPVEPQSKLDRLVPHDCIQGDPDDLIHHDWSGEWNDDLP